MAYVTSNPPRALVFTIGDDTTVWVYKSADAVATVVAASYVTNAKDLGMKVNDLVIVVDTATPLISTTRVTAVAASGSTMSAGVTVGNT